MYKYRKELISSKVDGLLKGRGLALFFHYSNVNAKDWQRIRAELALAGEIPLLVVKNRVAKRRILSSPSPSIQQPLTGLDLVRKRDQSSHLSLKPTSSATPEEETQFDSEKGRVSQSKGEQIDSRSMKNEKVADKVADFDLLQGPTLLVGCNSLKDFKLVFSILSKSGHFLLVGGIYNRKSINHSQLQRLFSLDLSLYTLLLQTLQTRVPFLLSLSQRYNFHLLTWYQRKLLFLLQQRLLKAIPSKPHI
jgi:hypothetical protein